MIQLQKIYKWHNSGNNRVFLLKDINLEVQEGDFVLLLGGGHGIKFREDTILLEVKQGPYKGESEKTRFSW